MYLIVRENPGSSPPARGTLCEAAELLLDDRFIPACAGNTIRSCEWSMKSAGSSPPARGTPETRPAAVRPVRFIPACAGNTCRPAPWTHRAPVHPRLRGEHEAQQQLEHREYGSSPPARGTQPHQVDRGALRRFIPACAGNTPRAATCAPRHPVHPRLRGEHPGVVQLSDMNVGSSPPARGTPQVPAAVSDIHRFIPACAGNTSSGSSPACCASVHPRLRGEHRRRARRAGCAAGSSPPARGTL